MMKMKMEMMTGAVVDHHHDHHDEDEDGDDDLCGYRSLS